MGITSSRDHDDKQLGGVVSSEEDANFLLTNIRTYLSSPNFWTQYMKDTKPKETKFSNYPSFPQNLPKYQTQNVEPFVRSIQDKLNHIIGYSENSIDSRRKEFHEKYKNKPIKTAEELITLFNDITTKFLGKPLESSTQPWSSFGALSSKDLQDKLYVFIMKKIQENTDTSDPESQPDIMDTLKKPQIRSTLPQNVSQITKVSDQRRQLRSTINPRDPTSTSADISGYAAKLRDSLLAEIKQASPQPQRSLRQQSEQPKAAVPEATPSYSPDNVVTNEDFTSDDDSSPPKPLIDVPPNRPIRHGQANIIGINPAKAPKKEQPKLSNVKVVNVPIQKQTRGKPLDAAEPSQTPSDTETRQVRNVTERSFDTQSTVPTKIPRGTPSNAWGSDTPEASEVIPQTTLPVQSQKPDQGTWADPSNREFPLQNDKPGTPGQLPSVQSEREGHTIWNGENGEFGTSTPSVYKTSRGPTHTNAIEQTVGSPLQSQDQRNDSSFKPASGRMFTKGEPLNFNGNPSNGDTTQSQDPSGLGPTARLVYGMPEDTQSRDKFIKELRQTPQAQKVLANLQSSNNASSQVAKPDGDTGDGTLQPPSESLPPLQSPSESSTPLTVPDQGQASNHMNDVMKGLKSRKDVPYVLLKLFEPESIFDTIKGYPKWIAQMHRVAIIVIKVIVTLLNKSGATVFNEQTDTVKEEIPSPHPIMPIFFGTLKELSDIINIKNDIASDNEKAIIKHYPLIPQPYGTIWDITERKFFSNQKADTNDNYINQIEELIMFALNPKSFQENQIALYVTHLKKNLQNGKKKLSSSKKETQIEKDLTQFAVEPPKNNLSIDQLKQLLLKYLDFTIKLQTEMLTKNIYIDEYAN